jgi:thiol-disulfide isomerase/thioredoxin
MEQMPHFQDLQEEYGDKINILAVNININETMDYISDVISENSLSMPILLDKEGKLSEALGLVGTPYSVLINTDNKIVYTTHESNSVLDTFVAKLANGEKLASDHDKALSSSEKMSIIEPWSKGRHTLFFTATWCDWYLKESRPNMASNCKKIQSSANELKDLSEAKSVHGFVNHLWTDEKALNDFTELYEIDYPVEIDENGVLFTHFNIRSIPTMLIVEDGKEVERINAEQIITLLEK